MNFEESVILTKSLAEALPDLFLGVELTFAFGASAPPIGDWSDASNPGMLIFGDGIGSKSGVYLFGSPNGEIIYIGKATKRNLHNRVWDHVKTPETTTDGRRVFPTHGFHGISHDSGEADNVRMGNARLGVITVSDPDVVSLLEVYLQTKYFKEHGRLPVLNKQIG